MKILVFVLFLLLRFFRLRRAMLLIMVLIMVFATLPELHRLTWGNHFSVPH